MSPLKPLPGKDVVKIFQKAGWKIARTHGSHVMMIKEGHEATLSIPQHKELGRGIIRTLIRQAKMTLEEFEKLQ